MNIHKTYKKIIKIILFVSEKMMSLDTNTQDDRTSK